MAQVYVYVRENNNKINIFLFGHNRVSCYLESLSSEENNQHSSCACADTNTFSTLKAAHISVVSGQNIFSLSAGYKTAKQHLSAIKSLTQTIIL